MGTSGVDGATCMIPAYPELAILAKQPVWLSFNPHPHLLPRAAALKGTEKLLPVTVGRSPCGNLPLGKLTWGEKIRNAAEDRAGSGCYSENLLYTHRRGSGAERAGLCTRVLPSFSVSGQWGYLFSALPLLPAPELALQGLVVPVILGQHPSQTPQILGIPH